MRIIALQNNVLICDYDSSPMDLVESGKPEGDFHDRRHAYTRNKDCVRHLIRRSVARSDEGATSIRHGTVIKSVQCICMYLPTGKRILYFELQVKTPA